VGHKSDDPCVHKKYTEAGVMTFVAHCTSVHRISGYHGYQADIRGIINGYQEKIVQISIE